MVESNGFPEIAFVAPKAVDRKGLLAKQPDDELVARTLGGEDLAFEALMDRYMPMVAGYLLGKTGNSIDAEDIAQEVFIAVFRNLPRLRTAKRFRSWLMQIARSKLFDHYRRAQRRPSLLPIERVSDSGDSSFAIDAADSRPDPSQHASSSETKRLIMREIGEMNESVGAILYLRLIGEETSGEIAERLGLKVKTVRSRLFRGMRKLRDALRKHELSLKDRF